MNIIKYTFPIIAASLAFFQGCGSKHPSSKLALDSGTHNVKYTITMIKNSAQPYVEGGKCNKGFPMSNLVTESYDKFEGIANVRNRCIAQAKNPSNCEAGSYARLRAIKGCETVSLLIEFAVSDDKENSIDNPDPVSKPSSNTIPIPPLEQKLCRGMVNDGQNFSIFRGEIIKLGPTCSNACASVLNQIRSDVAKLMETPQANWFAKPWTANIVCDGSEEEKQTITFN